MLKIIQVGIKERVKVEQPEYDYTLYRLTASASNLAEVAYSLSVLWLLCIYRPIIKGNSIACYMWSIQALLESEYAGIHANIAICSKCVHRFCLSRGYQYRIMLVQDKNMLKWDIGTCSSRILITVHTICIVTLNVQSK